jgi:hypothetical protein
MLVSSTFVGGITESVPKLSAKAQFSPSTTKTLNLVPELRKSVRFCPCAHAVANRHPCAHVVAVLFSPRCGRLVRAHAPHTYLAPSFEGTNGASGAPTTIAAITALGVVEEVRPSEL